MGEGRLQQNRLEREAFQDNIIACSRMTIQVLVAPASRHLARAITCFYKTSIASRLYISACPMRGSTCFRKVHLLNAFSTMPFSLWCCTISLQSFACFKILLKRPTTKCSEWIVCKRSSTVSSPLLRAIEKQISSYSGMNS